MGIFSFVSLYFLATAGRIYFSRNSAYFPPRLSYSTLREGESTKKMGAVEIYLLDYAVFNKRPFQMTIGWLKVWAIMRVSSRSLKRN